MQVVTYKYLSRSIKVHVNAAKQMLFNFVEEERKKKTPTQLGKTKLMLNTRKLTSVQSCGLWVHRVGPN